MNDPSGDVIEHLQLVFIELPKFPAQSTQEKKLRLLWLRFLREINEKTRTVPQDLLDIPEISEAVVLAEEAAYTKSELNAYEEYWDAVSTEKTRIFDKYEEGMAEGITKGEINAKQTIARRLLAQKMSPEEIAILIDLSLAEIMILAKK